SMILPEDSEYLGMTRTNRAVACGKNVAVGRQNTASFEHRALCPFRIRRNIDYHRLPILLEEVQCLCRRPSHLSSYTNIRCQPLQYSIPVLRRFVSHDRYIQSLEVLTLACIPLKPVRIL
ncbi:hypothetical protein PMAYCL1PPCAC_15999, partial [Pristionchus mayeri]